MPQQKLFRKFVLPNTGGKARVHVYGFAHGIEASVETGPSERIAGELRREAQNFSPRDYLMVEGFHDEHLNTLLGQLSEAEAREQSQRDFIGRVVKKHAPGVLERAERLEHFFPLMGIITGTSQLKNIERQIIRNEVEAQPREFKPVRDRTEWSLQDVEAYKRELAQALSNRFPNPPQDRIRVFVESSTTFRSLLMARAAFHRARATNGTVRLFCGSMHTQEIMRFLESESAVREYVHGLPTKLREFYEGMENFQAGVSSVFHRHSGEVGASRHADFLRWVAHRAQVHALEQVRDRTTRKFSVDMEEFIRQRKR
jgi:hypothetical protein